jgi:hypothetical protein
MAEGQGEHKSWIERAAEHVEHGAQYLDKAVKAGEIIHKVDEVVKATKEAAWFKDLSAGEKAMEYYKSAKDGLHTAEESGLGKTLGKATQVLTLAEGVAQFAEGAKMVYDGKTKEGTQKILGGSYDLLTGVVPGSGIAEMAINKGLDKLYDKELGKGDHKDGHLKEVITKTANDGLEKAGNFLGDLAVEVHDAVNPEHRFQSKPGRFEKIGNELGDKAYEGVQAAKAEAHKVEDKVVAEVKEIKDGVVHTAKKAEHAVVETAKEVKDVAVAAKDAVVAEAKDIKDGVVQGAKDVKDVAVAAKDAVVSEVKDVAKDVKDVAVAAKDAAVAEAHEVKDTVKHGWAALKEAVAHPVDTYHKLEAIAPQGVEVARAAPDR